MRWAFAILSLVVGCGSSSSADEPTPPANDVGVDVAPRATYRDPLTRVGSLVATDTNLEILEVSSQSTGRLLYCTNVRGLQLVDMRDPTALRRIVELRASVDPGKKPGCQHVAAEGDLAIISNRGSELHPVPYLAAFDIKAKQEVAVLSDTTRSFEGVAVENGAIYAAVHDQGLAIYERSGATFVERGRVPGIGNAIGVAVRDGIVYVADGQAALVIVDARDRAAPKILGRVSTGGTPQAVTIDGTHAYVAAGSRGLVVVDVADSTAPKVVATVDTPGTALAVAIAKGHAFVADWNDVRVFDVTTPAAPRLIATERVTTDKAFSRVLGLSAFEDHAFLGEWSGMYAYRLDPSARAPDLTIPVTSVELGGSTLTADVALANDGTEPLVIDAIESSVPAIAPSVPSLRIEPGQRASLKLTLTGAEQAFGKLTLRSDDPDEPVRTIELAANRPGVGVGDPAPTVEVDVLGGTTFRLSDYKGSVIVLSYFATF